MRRKRASYDSLKKELEDLVFKSKMANRDKVVAINNLLSLIEKEAATKQTERQRVTTPIVDDAKLQEKIGWSPYSPKRHDKQIEVLNCKSDQIVIMAGKRGGKTALCAYFALKGLLEGKDVLIVAPSYTLCGRIVEYIAEWVAKAFPTEIKVSLRLPQQVKTKWGNVIDCRSAAEPDQIMGKEYAIVVADECSKIPEVVNQRYISPATGMRLGKRYYISTPFGRNWFWRLWRKATEEGGGFTWKSIDNPYFTKDKWELEKKNLPDFIFKQEYEAEPQEDAMVFQGFNACLKDYGFPLDYNPNHFYITGIDLGKYENFTAVSVMDRMTNQEVEHLRFQGDWTLQKERITSVLDKYGKCLAWIDATSITTGDAYVDELQNEGYNAMGFKLGGTSKRQLIEKLIVKIQNRNVSFPKDEASEEAKEANTESRAFSYEMSPSGNVLYRAPEGEYDDCVIARALACWELDDQPLTELKKGQIEGIKFPNQEF